MKNALSLAEAAAFLREHDNYLIFTHRRPDGDTIGSAAALCLTLRALGKNAFVEKNSQLTPRYSFLIENLYPQEGFHPAQKLLCDTASAKQLSPEGAAVFESDPTAFSLNIDHHVSNTGFARSTLCLPKAACGEVVFALAKELGTALTTDIARAIYVAAATDTGCFRFSNTTADTLAVAAEMAKFPIGQAELNYKLFLEQSAPRMALLQLLLKELRFYRNGEICTVTLTLSMLQESAATEDDAEGFAGLAREIAGVHCGILLREEPGGKVRVSVRSSEKLNASALCENFGGGGHVRAAGCGFVSSAPAEAEALLVKKAEELLSAK